MSQNDNDQSLPNCNYKISIDRYPVDFSYIDKKYGFKPPETVYSKIKSHIASRLVCNLSCILAFTTSIFPILTWIPKYRREFLLPDFIAGFTISVLHIPQGMAYGVLATVRAENGLYVSFFPVLIYCLLGTSRHVSIGTFAVVSLMLSSATHGLAINNIANINSGHYITNETSKLWESPPPSNIQILTSLCIAVGLCQIFMGIFHLGLLTVVLSDQMISGFTTGVACHVAVSQLKDLFGIDIGIYNGVFKLLYMVRDMFENLVHTNITTFIISTVALFVLAAFKEQINERFKDKLPMPIPIDLIIVIIATITSYYAKFNANYEVNVIKEIPTGLPVPEIPRFDIMYYLIGDIIAIATVSFVITLSMSLLLVKRNKYSIRPNQELIALGSANVFSSFFACFPCGASLSRSLVQEKAGGKTQVAGIVSCCILLIVLLVLAPTFYHLPKCILSCIILVALKPMFMQAEDFFTTWNASKLEAILWLLTFLSTVILDVIYGLIIGVVFTVATVIIRTVMPVKTFLGRIPNTDIYLDTKCYHAAEEVEGIKIFHFGSPLYFINKDLFKFYLTEKVQKEEKNEDDVTKTLNVIHRIIIDCSTFTFIDMSGINTILEIINEYHTVGINVFLSGCSGMMHEMMEKANFSDKVPQHPYIFPTIHDAVSYCHISNDSINDC